MSTVCRYSGKYNTNGDTDKARATKYYADIGDDVLQGLYKKYYWDFKIFGYTPAYIGHPELDDGIQ